MDAAIKAGMQLQFNLMVKAQQKSIREDLLLNPSQELSLDFMDLGGDDAVNVEM